MYETEAGLLARTDAVRNEILAHIGEHPDDFDGREHLYMQHDDLRYALTQLEELAAVPSLRWSERLTVWLFGKQMIPSFGVGLILTHIAEGHIL